MIDDQKNDRFTHLDISDSVKEFLRSHGKTADFRSFKFSAKLNSLGGVDITSKLQASIHYSKDGLISEVFFQKDFKQLLSFLVNKAYVDINNITVRDYFNNELDEGKKEKLLVPIEEIAQVASKKITPEVEEDPPLYVVDYSAPYIFRRYDIEPLKRSPEENIVFSPIEIISKMGPKAKKPKNRKKEAAFQEESSEANTGTTDTDKIPDDEASQNNVVSTAISSEEIAKDNKEWIIKENKKFIKIIKDWYSSTGAENYEEFLKKYNIDNVISAKDFEDVLEGNAVFSKKLASYLSAQLPPEIFGDIWFRGMGSRALEIAGDKRIVGNNEVEIVNSVAKQVSEILTERLVYAKTFKESPEFHNKKFEEFIAGLSEIVQNRVARTGQKELAIDFDTLIDDVSLHLGLSYPQFKGKKIVSEKDADKAAKAFASILIDPKKPDDLQGYNELYELANNFWTGKTKEIEGEDPHNAIGISIRFIRKSKGMYLDDFTVWPETISRIERGITNPLLGTVNSIFGDFNLSKEKPNEKEDSEFDKITILFKEKVLPFQVTNGRGGMVEITKEGFILIRALQQNDLKKGFKIIRAEKEGKHLGTYLRYIRMYADKFNKNGEYSIYELDKQQPEPETFVRLFQGYGLSRENEPESDYDIAINEVTELFPAYSNNYSENGKKQFSTKESMMVVKAILEPDLDKALEYLRNDDLRKTIGNVMRFVRLRDNKTIYDFEKGTKSVRGHRISKIEKGGSFPHSDTLIAVFSGCSMSDEDFNKITNFLKKELIKPSSTAQNGAPSEQDILMLRALRKKNLHEGLDVIKSESEDASNKKAANGLRFIREYKNRDLSNFGIDKDLLYKIETIFPSISEDSFYKMLKDGGLSRESKSGEPSEYDIAIGFFKDILPYYKKGEKRITIKEDLIIAVAMQKNGLGEAMDYIAHEITGDDLIGVYLKFLRVNNHIETDQFVGLNRRDVTNKEHGDRDVNSEYLIKFFAGVNYPDEDFKTILQKFDEHVYIGTVEKFFGHSPRTVITFSHSVEGRYNKPGTWESYLTATQGFGKELL